MLSFLVVMNLCRFFLSFVYICMPFEVQLSRGEGWVLFTGLAPPYVCTCRKPGHGIPSSYVVCVCVSVFVFDEFASEERSLFALLLLVKLMPITI